jgi:hypothetical protein
VNRADREQRTAAKAKAEEIVRSMLKSVFSRGGPVVHNDPDYAHAYGIMQGLSLLGVVTPPANGSSQFWAIRKEVEDAVAKAATKEETARGSG